MLTWKITTAWWSTVKIILLCFNGLICYGSLFLDECCMSVFVQLDFSRNSCCLLFCNYNILRYNYDSCIYWLRSSSTICIYVRGSIVLFFLIKAIISLFIFILMQDPRSKGPLHFIMDLCHSGWAALVLF